MDAKSPENLGSQPPKVSAQERGDVYKKDVSETKQPVQEFYPGDSVYYKKNLLYEIVAVDGSAQDDWRYKIKDADEPDDSKAQWVRQKLARLRLCQRLKDRGKSAPKH